MNHYKCKCGWLVHSNVTITVNCPICGQSIGCEGTLQSMPYPGLGDCIAIATRYTGIAWLVKRLTAGKCGCPARQAKLNTLGSRLHAKAMQMWRNRRW